MAGDAPISLREVGQSGLDALQETPPPREAAPSPVETPTPSVEQILESPPPSAVHTAAHVSETARMVAQSSKASLEGHLGSTLNVLGEMDTQVAVPTGLAAGKENDNAPPAGQPTPTPSPCPSLLPEPVPNTAASLREDGPGHVDQEAPAEETDKKGKPPGYWRGRTRSSKIEYIYIYIYKFCDNACQGPPLHCREQERCDQVLPRRAQNGRDY